jgi:hypothetical protein
MTLKKLNTKAFFLENSVFRIPPKLFALNQVQIGFTYTLIQMFQNSFFLGGFWLLEGPSIQ